MPLEDDAMSEDRRGWHVGKEIPLAMLVALLLQTAGVVWWASGVSRDVQELIRRIAIQELKVETMTKEMRDATTPSAVAAVQIQALFNQVSELRSQVEALRNDRNRNRD